MQSASLSNTERQARHRVRMKALMESAVTPDDVLRAARLIYEDSAKVEQDLQPWDAFLASLTSKGRTFFWARWVPDDLDPAAYDHLPPDDAAICLKVAAVARAVRYPPGE